MLSGENEVTTDKVNKVAQMHKLILAMMKKLLLQLHIEALSFSFRLRALKTWSATIFSTLI